MMMCKFHLFALVITLCTSFVIGTWDLSDVLSKSRSKSSDGSNPNDMVKLRGSGSVTAGGKEGGLCYYDKDVSKVIQHLLCAVESGTWGISSTSRAMTEIACLIDQTGERCRSGVRPIPTEDTTPKSPAPPNAKNKDYQRYAEKAEELVPKTWWREGFSSDSLLLSHNDKELPYKFFDERKSVKNKKLKNLHQCVSRQVFIRKSFSFSTEFADNVAEDAEAEDGGSAADIEAQVKGNDKDKQRCTAAQEPSIQNFRKLFSADPMWGGEYRAHTQSRLPSNAKGKSSNAHTDLVLNGWYPTKQDDGKLFMAAHETLQWFFANTGGIWTGCFKLMHSGYCRGALASAALIVSSHLLVDIAGSEGKSSTNKVGIGTTLVEGYILASLGRGLLHGDTDTAGESSSTVWQVSLVDFIALQQAFLKVYIDSFGAVYARQLETHIPVAFPPGLNMYTKKAWKHVNDDHINNPATANDIFEPIYSHLRNWMFTESGNLIDFGPYRPLVAIPEVNEALHADKRRRILVDVGANGFFASPKYLLDSYAPYLPFTDAIMIEPEPHFSSSIPASYNKKYKITHQKIYAEVNTGSKTDILKLLATLVSPEDYVVLKFDVDPNKHAWGPTMEWGFLFDMAKTPEVAELIDELYIELHFHYPALYWQHYHSNWEALDALRYLRSLGAVIHAWP